MSKFDPSKLKGHSSEAAVYWRAAALSSTELARGFRVHAEAAEALQRRTLRRVELEQERGRKLYAVLKRTLEVLLPYAHRQVFAPEHQCLPGELIEAMTADDAAAHAILNDTETTP